MITIKSDSETAQMCERILKNANIIGQNQEWGYKNNNEQERIILKQHKDDPEIHGYDDNEFWFISNGVEIHVHRSSCKTDVSFEYFFMYVDKNKKIDMTMDDIILLDKILINFANKIVSYRQEKESDVVLKMHKELLKLAEKK